MPERPEMKNQDDYLREQIEQLKAQRMALQSYARTTFLAGRATLLSEADAHLQSAVVALTALIDPAETPIDPRFTGVDREANRR